MDSKYDSDIIKDAQDVSADDLSVVSGGLEAQPITLTESGGPECHNKNETPESKRNKRQRRT